MGVPVAEQQGNNNLNIIGTCGLAGQMPPTPSQPFTVNATPVPTIVNVGGNGCGGSGGGGGNGSGGSISLSTTRSSNMSTRLPTIPSNFLLRASAGVRVRVRDPCDIPIPVKDISKVNRMIGFGTVMHKC